MKGTQLMRILSSGMILSPAEAAESSPEDDVDRLFAKLNKLEPPGDIVKQILARIKHLPAPRPLSQSEAGEIPVEEPREAAE